MEILGKHKLQMRAINHFFLIMNYDELEEDLWDMLIFSFTCDDVEHWDSTKRHAILSSFKELLDLLKAVYTLEEPLKEYFQIHIPDLNK